MNSLVNSVGTLRAAELVLRGVLVLKRNDAIKNARRLRRLEIALGIVFVTFYVLCLAIANASDRVSSPMSVKLSPQDAESHNGDFLKNISAPQSTTSLNSMIFEKSVSDEMKAKFDSFNKNYEHRNAYQLNKPEDYLKYEKENQNLADWTLKRLLQFHVETTLRNSVENGAKRTAEQAKSSDERTAARTVMAIANAQKAITNGTFNIGKGTTTKFKYDIPSGAVRLGMTGPIVDASVDYRVKALNPQMGSVSQPEKLSVGMNKSFKQVGASTKVQYAVNNEQLNYGASKHLVGPVSAQVDQSHSIRDVTKDETVYRMNLGLNF